MIAMFKRLFGVAGHKTIAHKSSASMPVDDYALKLAQEVANYTDVVNVNNLPPIHDYWAQKYIVPLVKPFGFHSSETLYGGYIASALEKSGKATVEVVTLGAGNCELEINIAKALYAAGHRRFSIECLELNPAMVARGKLAAQASQVNAFIKFSIVDVNVWVPDCQSFSASFCGA